MEEQRGCECPPLYLRTIPGILKIVEMVFTILTFSISFGMGWNHAGGGWVEFTGVSCFVTVTIWLFLHLIKLPPRIIVSYLWELISYGIMTLCLLISGIVAAVRSQQATQYYPDHYSGGLGACSFFAFASAFVCGVDFFLQYQAYQRGVYHSTTTASTVETTTVSQSTVRVKY